VLISLDSAEDPVEQGYPRPWRSAALILGALIANLWIAGLLSMISR
jgi:hypothetical protein